MIYSRMLECLAKLYDALGNSEMAAKWNDAADKLNKARVSV